MGKYGEEGGQLRVGWAGWAALVHAGPGDVRRAAMKTRSLPTMSVSGGGPLVVPAVTEVELEDEVA